MGTIFNPPHPQGAPLPPPSAHPAVLGSSQVQLAAQGAKKAGAATEGMGFDNTIQTSPQGLKPPTTAKATLLG